ncbi:MAG: hypothetical protein EZS28_021129 [Streblomastix strix]|uniref:Uncharacterized protein n=1 Tax=Streblomastix strix TaxID=222440 RepID=A0A5J4VLP1_9EUKA|nr:MAG: hypothetical protein EZS28_021129 [Streblomastix strix]
MSTIQTNQIRVHKSKHASAAKKELSEEDKTRLQAIDDARANNFRRSIPMIQKMLKTNREKLKQKDHDESLTTFIDIKIFNVKLFSIDNHYRYDLKMLQYIQESIEKLYRIIKDFIKYADKVETDIGQIGS